MRKRIKKAQKNMKTLFLKSKLVKIKVFPTAENTGIA